MIDMRETGKTLKQIGTAFGVSKQRVAQVIGNTGHISRGYLTEEDVECFTAMHYAGYSLKEKEKELGRRILGLSTRLNLPRGRKYPDGYKRCALCSKVLPEDNFYTNSNACVPCTKARQRKYQNAANKRTRSKPGYKWKMRCRGVTHRLVKSGNLIKSPCAQAHLGNCRGRIEAHHYAGYDEPGLVEWYCIKHHRDIDGAKWQVA